MTFKHFSIEERERIQEMLWQKASVRSIARALHRSSSSISREIHRNIPLKRIYKPRLAHERAIEKRKNRGRKLRLKSGFIRHYVVAGLKNGLSPEQIAGRLSCEYPDRSISHEAIYQWIYSMIHRDGWGDVRPHYPDLRRYLKRRHKRRGQKGMRTVKRVLRPQGVFIDERSEEVESRKTIGHWETDSMVSRQSTAALNTVVERKTGLVFITKVPNGTAEATKTALTTRLLRLSRDFRHTITSDNGSENACFDSVETELGVRWYFTHPYHSWERGTNENTNGLIRWYFPKKTDFAKISDEAIKTVEDALNNRPRKRLRWKTPLEAFNESVALTG